MDQLGTGLLN